MCIVLSNGACPVVCGVHSDSARRSSAWHRSSLRGKGLLEPEAPQIAPTLSNSNLYLPIMLDVRGREAMAMRIHTRHDELGCGICGLWAQAVGRS